MHAATATEARTTTCNCQFAAEKVGLRRIRLALPCQCLSASVGTFFAADKVLLGWTLRHPAPLDCAFEIVYDDGQTLAGEYRLQRPPATRPALMAFVRKALAGLCDGSGQGTPVRGLADGPHSFLAHYDTEDFIHN